MDQNWLRVSQRRRSRATQAAAASTQGTARTTMHGSCRPGTTSVVSQFLARSTLCCGTLMDGVGLKAAQNTTGMPVVMPPRMPPHWLVFVRTQPSVRQKASFAWEPRSCANAKPDPKLSPLTAGMPNTARAMRFSTPSNMGSPNPAGSPVMAHSITPPTESPARFAQRMRSCMAPMTLSSLTHSVRSAAA